MTDDTNALPTGFNLHRYMIEGILGAGGFGITYRAMHEALENEVAIKEYFPAEWAYRDHNGITVRANAQGQIPARNGEPPCYDWGLYRFLDEAKILVQINHPNVVRVKDYFSANGSAYIVMEYEDGESMSTSLQRGGILPEQELRRLLNDVLPALEAVHTQGYLHRDLKPSNLYIRSRDSHVMLIDFGAARQALGRRTRSVTSVVTPGYSPIEQYVTVGEDYGPWTDIYALGAVMYRCITGAPPVEAPGRVLRDPVQPAMETGAGLYSEGLLQVVDRAIIVRPEHRYQSVSEMREALQQAEEQGEIDFSRVPPIRAEELDLPPPSRLPLELVPSTPPRSSRGETYDNGDQARPDWQLSQPAPRSRPSQRSRPASTESVSSPFQPDEESSKPLEPLQDDSHGSLPMLENIWEHLDEGIQEGDERPVAEDTVADLRKKETPTLLQRAPQSAVEHLRKLSSSPKRNTSAVSPEEFPEDEKVVLESPRSQTVTTSTESPPLLSIPPPINWKRTGLTILVTAAVFAVSLFGYQYYSSTQEERQREEEQLQQQQAEAEAQRTQQQTARQNIEINRYVEQARGAIGSRELKRAALYLERAAALNANHPDVIAARAELLATQQPEARRKTYTDKTTGMTLQWIEGDCFEMGSPPTERDRGSNEQLHKSCVKGFWIGEHEVTNDQYRRFKAEHNSGSFQSLPLNADQQPVIGVSWNDAVAFTEWLSWESGDGKRFRLPTEAEWEFAARAGTHGRYYWGDELNPEYANFSDRNDPTGASIGNLDDKQAVTAPVGSYQPNAWGLHDVSGNVWEWTCSEYSFNYNGQEETCSDQYSSKGQRVVRGGSWNNGPGDLRSAKRLPRRPDHRDKTTGFRFVMTEQ